MQFRGTPLADLPQEKSGWTTGMRISEMQTARAWGKLPTEFDNLPEDEKAWMMALQKTEGKMRGYDVYRSEERRKADARKATSRKGSRGHH